jgi:hypothetical protein
MVLKLGQCVVAVELTQIVWTSRSPVTRKCVRKLEAVYGKPRVGQSAMLAELVAKSGRRGAQEIMYRTVLEICLLTTRVA